MEKLIGGKYWFTATVGKTSVKKGEPDNFVVCLCDIEYKGELIKDHAWVNKRDNFPRKGCRIEFRANVVEYLSIDDDGNHVMKVGLKKLRYIKEIE